jgi:effector-binding domain-containing protein
MSTQTLTCEVIDYPSQLVVGIRTHSPQKDLSVVIPEMLKKVDAYFAEIGKKPTEPPYVAYYNDDMDNLDVEIGYITTEKLQSKGDVKSGTIGGGKGVSCMYTGSYSTLYKGHEAAHNYVAANGYQHAGTAYEIYIDDPDKVAESELKTQVVVMIKS